MSRPSPTSRTESRWPAAITVCASLGLFLLLPETLSPGPKYLVPGIELALLIPLMLANPSAITKESTELRHVSILLIAVLNLTTIVSISFLVHDLLAGSDVAGQDLIRAGIALWITLVTGFALTFWELDRGGPQARTRDEQRVPDFLFTQMTNPSHTHHNWAPRFVDYAYLSLTNAIAFSPTDTLPLTPRAKFLMGLHSLASFATVVIVGARAINILR